MLQKSFILAIILFTGCEFDSYGIEKKIHCQTQKDCTQNYICLNNKCVQPADVEITDAEDAANQADEESGQEQNCEPEICDGIDNDCDDKTDEDFIVGGECNVSEGVCKAFGRYICNHFGSLVCNAEPKDFLKTQEICDELDNDCDGEIDEEAINCCMPGQAKECSTDIGECIKGFQVCDEQRAWQPCAGKMPKLEICDELDNNCDGQIDENFDLSTDKNNCGECGIVCGSANTSEIACANGHCALKCQPLAFDLNQINQDGCECVIQNSGIEICNQIDDDCDNLINDNCQSVVLYFTFDEFDNNRFLDKSGHNLFGLNIGAMQDLDAISGKSVNFDGQSFIEVQQNNLLNFSNNITFLFWIKPQNQNRDDESLSAIISHGFHCTNQNPSWEINLTNEPSIRLYWSIDGQDFEIMPSGWPILPKNTWSHIAIVFQNGASILYFNGEEMLQSFGDAERIFTNNQSIFIGKNNCQDSFLTDVKLDELVIYNRVLTANEIMRIYQIQNHAP